MPSKTGKEIHGWYPGVVIDRHGKTFTVMNEGTYVSTPTRGLWVFEIEWGGTGGTDKATPMAVDKIVSYPD